MTTPPLPEASRRSSTLRWVLFLVLAVSGLARLFLATSTPLIYDEYAWIDIADGISLHPLRLPLHGDQHPTGAAYLAASGAGLLGRNLAGYRLASVLLGTALVWATAWIGTRAFGPGAGLAAAALVGLNEYLLGGARLATEKSYLAFAVLALVAFTRALETGERRSFIAAGALFGMGLMTKETLALWLPLFAWELWGRRGGRAFRSAGPWAGALIAIALTVPDLVWNATAPPTASWSDRGLGWHAARIRPGWSFGPLALFLRPVGPLTIERSVSEYASMSVIPGGLLLAGALLSVVLLRDRPARFLQALGFTPFLVFTLLASPRLPLVAEFWWSDLSVVPFTLLTAGVIGRLPVAAVGLGLLVAAAVPGAVHVMAARENCYPPSLPTIAPLVERCQENQRAFIVRFRRRDHAALCHVGSLVLPAARHYARCLEEYEGRLREGRAGRAAGEGWPFVSPENLEDEIAWAEAEARRLGRLEN